MSAFSICTYVQRQKDERNWKILSIFVLSDNFIDEQLDDEVAPLLGRAGPFDAVHFIGFNQYLQKIVALQRGESTVFQRLAKTVIDFDSKVRFVSLGDEGRPQCRSLIGDDICDENLIEDERRQSLQNVFIRRNGLVTASMGVHYTKPSGSHAAQFLRVANVLEDSAVTFQLAFWLMAKLGTKYIKRIVVDTSGIDSIAFVLGYERVRHQLQNDLPIIESHSSYGGLAGLSVPDPSETIFLISASTSGGLHDVLLSKGAKTENIYTLFFLGKKDSPGRGNVLCDLGFDEKLNSNGLPTIRNFDIDNCPYCKEHSYAIPIVGDQFSTEPARIQEIDIALADFAESHREVLAQLASTNLFKVFRSVDGKDFELFLDVEAMFSVSLDDTYARAVVLSLKTRWKRLIHRGLPIHLRRIVYTNYPGAKSMAGDVNTFVQESRNSMPAKHSVISSKELQGHKIDCETASLIVSACLDETYELMGISRDLRTIQPGGNTTYVAPIFRSSSKSERSRVESNLTYGEHGPKTFNLYSALQIELPSCEKSHSWKLEFEKLLALKHWSELEGIELPTEIERRIELLRRAPAVGLSEDIFWPSSTECPLKLGSDFTMVPTRDGDRHLSQADIFAIATSLFHQYRQGVNKKPKLIYKPYERTVISPESFQRFSDGVLQAAFLRAARASEIAYGNCEESVSERMYEFLKDEVIAAKNGMGPALMEYVVAMMIGRLTLHVKHKEKFLDLVADEPLLPDWMRITAKFTQTL